MPAGRDGKPSECILYYAKRDVPRILQLLHMGARRGKGKGGGGKEQFARELELLKQVKRGSWQEGGKQRGGGRCLMEEGGRGDAALSGGNSGSGSRGAPVQHARQPYRSVASPPTTLHPNPPTYPSSTLLTPHHTTRLSNLPFQPCRCSSTARRASAAATPTSSPTSVRRGSRASAATAATSAAAPSTGSSRPAGAAATSRRGASGERLQLVQAAAGAAAFRRPRRCCLRARERQSRRRRDQHAR